MVPDPAVMDDVIELDGGMGPLPQPALLLLGRHFRLDRRDEIPMCFWLSERWRAAIEEIIESFRRFTIPPWYRHVLDRQVRPGHKLVRDRRVARLMPDSRVGGVVVVA
jgi:hypothetical protein